MYIYIFPPLFPSIISLHIFPPFYFPPLFWVKSNFIIGHWTLDMEGKYGGKKKEGKKRREKVHKVLDLLLDIGHHGKKLNKYGLNKDT